MTTGRIADTAMAPGRRTLMAAAGLAMTLMIFYAMTTLIRQDETLIFIDPAPGMTVSFVREIQDEEPPVVDRIQKPPVVEPPPITERLVEVDEAGSGTELTFTPPTVTRPERTIARSDGFDGEAVPLVTSPPEYPGRAVERGIEGWVIVEFSIDPMGRVFEPRVIEGQPAGIFDSAALRAIQRYKYKPRVLNGEGIPVSGVRQRILFELDS